MGICTDTKVWDYFLHFGWLIVFTGLIFQPFTGNIDDWKEHKCFSKCLCAEQCATDKSYFGCLFVAILLYRQSIKPNVQRTQGQKWFVNSEWWKNWESFRFLGQTQLLIHTQPCDRIAILSNLLECSRLPLRRQKFPPGVRGYWNLRQLLIFKVWKTTFYTLLK